MKKIIIILSCVGLVSTISCRDRKEAERRRLEIERIRQEQEVARLADEQRLLELQLRSKQDSLLLSVSQTKKKKRARAYYVVIGSFQVASNAYSYMESLRSTFSSISVVPSRGWNFVTVGGAFGSRYAAARMLQTVLNTSSAPTYTPAPVVSQSSSSDDEEYDEEEEESEDEEEEESEDEEEEVEADSYDDGVVVQETVPTSAGFSGQAWIMAL